MGTQNEFLITGVRVKVGRDYRVLEKDWCLQKSGKSTQW